MPAHLSKVRAAHRRRTGNESTCIDAESSAADSRLKPGNEVLHRAPRIQERLRVCPAEGVGHADGLTAVVDAVGVAFGIAHAAEGSQVMHGSVVEESMRIAGIERADDLTAVVDPVGLALPCAQGTQIGKRVTDGQRRAARSEINQAATKTMPSRLIRSVLIRFLELAAADKSCFVSRLAARLTQEILYIWATAKEPGGLRSSNSSRAQASKSSGSDAALGRRVRPPPRPTSRSPRPLPAAPVRSTRTAASPVTSAFPVRRSGVAA